MRLALPEAKRLIHRFLPLWAKQGWLNRPVSAVAHDPALAEPHYSLVLLARSRTDIDCAVKRPYRKHPLARARGLKAAD